MERSVLIQLCSEQWSLNASAWFVLPVQSKQPGGGDGSVDLPRVRQRAV